jgi:hypothetical protein
MNPLFSRLLLMDFSYYKHTPSNDHVQGCNTKIARVFVGDGAIGISQLSKILPGGLHGSPCIFSLAVSGFDSPDPMCNNSNTLKSAEII